LIDCLHSFLLKSLNLAMTVCSLLVVCLVLSFSLSAVHGYLPSFNPEYCSKDYESKSIPALSATQLTQVDSLAQVQVMIRHGARTPYALFPCWKNYDVTWNNCNVTELMMESPSYTSMDPGADWLFRKIYDGSANYLGGNCLTGQLLLEGYNQELSNGIHLNEAYMQGDLKLFPTAVWDEIDNSAEVYLRSDDEQRTVMSGQLLVHTMFNVSGLYWGEDVRLRLSFSFAHFSINFDLFLDYSTNYHPMAHWRLQFGSDLPEFSSVPSS
jgi:2-phosphoxylose phosphatase